MEDQAMCAEKESQVMVEMSKLKNAIDGIKDAVSRVQERVTIATVPQIPTPEGVSEKAKDNLVPLASSLKGMRETVESQVNRLYNLTDRIEL